MSNKFNNQIGLIIQARMGSSRLPGKVLLNLDESNTVLDVLIKRLKLSRLVDEIIIATSKDKKNKEIIRTAKDHNISYFIGSEENVLERYYKTAKRFKIDIVIRVCSDNPFIDPMILDDLIEFYNNHNYDYVRINHETTNFPLGFLSEIFSFDILKKVFNSATKKPEKEHVTYYIYNHPEIFSIFDYTNSRIEQLKRFEDLRLTIDEEEDLILCRTICKKLKDKGKSIDFSLYDIIHIIEEFPELMNINKHINQKKI